MKKALISPNEQVSYQSGWNITTKPVSPVYSFLPNSARIAEVAEQSFEVALPLFWVDCADDLNADLNWYNTLTQTIDIIPAPPPKPAAPDQPASTGTQTL